MGKAERTKQFIIETAAPIFNEKGIAGTTIDDILSATRMAKGGLYGHFDSKEEISYTVIDYLLSKLTQEVSSIFAREKTALKKLYAFLDFYKKPMDSFIEGGCPILNFGVESDDTNPVVRQKVRAVIEAGQKRLTAAIQQGIEDGEFSSAMIAEDMALKIFATVEGGMMISRVFGTNKHMFSLIKMLKNEVAGYVIK